KPVIVGDAGGLKSAPIVDPAGHALIYTIPLVSPFRRPQGAGGAGRAGRAGGAGGAGGAGSGLPPPSFAIVDLASHRVSTVFGAAPALSADGRTLAYVARDQTGYDLMVGPTPAVQTRVH